VRGPWPVGDKTVKFGRFNAVSVMYPAKPGSEAGKQELTYDMRSFLIAAERSKIPDDQNKNISVGTYADLPLDEEHGPYPVVILVHGTSSFRVASGTTQAHWASRGFVVIAADHPNLSLEDIMGAQGCGLVVPPLDLNGDVDSEIAALKSPTGDLAFLAGHIDMTRVALTGHSAGAFNTAQFSGKPGVQIVMPLAGTHPVNPSSSLKSVLYVSGIADAVLSYAPPQSGVGGLLYPGTSTDAYDASPTPPSVKKRLVGIVDGGHLVVTDLCQTNDMGKYALQVAEANGVCGVGFVIGLGLFDCGTVDRVKATTIVNDATAAALEETLHCMDRTTRLASLKSRYPLVGDFQEAK
jgi:dienelactone hydrolase